MGVTRRLRIGLVVTGVAALVAYFGGCSSAVLPPDPTAAERAHLAETHFPLRAGVERFQIPVYSDELIRNLRDTGLFDAVDESDRLGSPPDLIVRVQSPPNGAAVIPLLTAISFGFIPTVADETWGTLFSLSSPRDPTRRVVIEARWTGPTTLGWVSALLNLSPNRTGGEVKTHPRTTLHFAVLLADQAQAIEALAQR